MALSRRDASVTMCRAFWIALVQRESLFWSNISSTSSVTALGPKAGVPPCERETEQQEDSMLSL